MTGSRILLLLLVAGTAVLAFSQCNGEPETPRPKVEGAILEVAGVSILRAEVEEHFEYFDSVDRKIGRKTRIREILTELVLPRAFARRDFAAERQAQLEQARALADVVDNYRELAERGPALGGQEPEKPWSRSALPFPVAAFLFDDLNVGRASEPIETPQGWVVVAPREILRGPRSPMDLCHAFVVWFHHQSTDDYRLWWSSAREAARGAVTYVAPEYREALPLWLTP